MSSELFAPSRRSLLVGLTAALSAPLVVRAESLMQIKGVVQPWPRDHRWLAAYCIGTDEIHLRADTVFGSPALGAFNDPGFYAPAMPRIYHGLWVPNEKGLRVLDKLNAVPLDALYRSFDAKALTDARLTKQSYVDITLSRTVLQDMLLWESRGYNVHMYKDGDD